MSTNTTIDVGVQRRITSKNLLKHNLDVLENGSGTDLLKATKTLKAYVVEDHNMFGPKEPSGVNLLGAYASRELNEAIFNILKYPKTAESVEAAEEVATTAMLKGKTRISMEMIHTVSKLPGLNSDRILKDVLSKTDRMDVSDEIIEVIMKKENSNITLFRIRPTEPKFSVFLRGTESGPEMDSRPAA